MTNMGRDSASRTGRARLYHVYCDNAPVPALCQPAAGRESTETRCAASGFEIDGSDLINCHRPDTMRCKSAGVASRIPGPDSDRLYSRRAAGAHWPAEVSHRRNAALRPETSVRRITALRLKPSSSSLLRARRCVFWEADPAGLQHDHPADPELVCEPLLSMVMLEWFRRCSQRQSRMSAHAEPPPRVCAYCSAQCGAASPAALYRAGAGGRGAAYADGHRAQDDFTAQPDAR